MSKFVARSRKAVAGGVLAAGGVAGSVASVENELVRFGAVAGAFLVGFVLVWVTPNDVD